MNGYAIALFVHLLCLLLACAAASVATLAALRLRRAGTAGEAIPWIAFTERVVLAFPMAALGLLGTGIFMTHQRWTWSAPWIDAGLVALALIMALGKGVEARRMGMLKRELEASGMTPAARRLLRDPVTWSAKMTTLTLSAAAVFMMTDKPTGVGCVLVMLLAVAGGVLGAVPMWWTSGAEATELVRSATS